jgi:hypothetical protein
MGMRVRSLRSELLARAEAGCYERGGSLPLAEALALARDDESAAPSD